VFSITLASGSLFGLSYGFNRTHSCIFTTHDGHSWRSHYTKQFCTNYHQAVVLSVTKQHAFIQCDDAILRTTDGINYTRIEFHFQDTKRIRRLKFLTENIGYLLVWDEFTYLIAMTFDGGITWARCATLPLGCDYIDVHFVMENSIHLIGNCQYRSMFGGILFHTTDFISWHRTTICNNDNQNCVLQKLEYFNMPFVRGYWGNNGFGAPFVYGNGRSYQGYPGYLGTDCRFEKIPLTASYISPTQAIAWRGMKGCDGTVQTYWSYSNNGVDFVAPLERFFIPMHLAENERERLELATNRQGWWIGGTRAHGMERHYHIYHSRDRKSFESQPIHGYNHTESSCIAQSIRVNQI
jgi:hypothetical protein